LLASGLLEQGLFYQLAYTNIDKYIPMVAHPWISMRKNLCGSIQGIPCHRQSATLLQPKTLTLEGVPRSTGSRKFGTTRSSTLLVLDLINLVRIVIVQTGYIMICEGELSYDILRMDSINV
jgi:hypothetical protein